MIIDVIDHQGAELRELETFEAVARLLSFSAAAERLHLTQSSVSSRIQRLERAWGVRLFDRGPHHVDLTADGRALLGPAGATLQRAAALREAVDEVHGVLRGDLRLGVTQAPETPGPFSIAADIAAFITRHPGVDLHLRQASGQENVTAVRAGEIDLAYAPIGATSPPGVSRITVASARMHLICHADHPLARRSSVALDELTHEHFADFPPGWGARTATDEALAAAGVDRQIAFEINDLGMITDLVRNQLAVAILPRFTLGPEDPVVWTPIAPTAPVFTLSLITPTTRALPAAVRAYAEAASSMAALR